MDDVEQVEVIEQQPKVKRVPVVVEEYKDEATGHLFRRYDTGMIHDATIGRIVKPPAPEFRGIRPDNAKFLRQKQVEDAELAIAHAIADKSRKSGKIYSTDGPVEALAAAAGQLWDEVVLNSRAKARDRREMYETLGRDAGLRRDARESRQDGGPDAPLMLNIDALRAAVDEFTRAKQALNAPKQAE